MLKDTLDVLNGLERDGLFSTYAIFGAMAAMFYADPVATEDLDVLILLPASTSPLVSLSPIYARLQGLGFSPKHESIVIHGVPVQFVPTYNDLTTEALRMAQSMTVQGTSTRVVGANHLAAIALQTARAKDFARVAALLDSGAVQLEMLRSTCSRHNIPWPPFLSQ
jgi:hypothetical protein